MRGDFVCQACGLQLRDVRLPLRHDCRGRAKTTAAPPAKPRSESDFVFRGGKPNCVHFGPETEIVVRCTCPSSELVPIFECRLFGTTTTVPVRSSNLRRAIDTDGSGLRLPATCCAKCWKSIEDAH